MMADQRSNMEWRGLIEDEIGKVLWETGFFHPVRDLRAFAIPQAQLLIVVPPVVASLIQRGVMVRAGGGHGGTFYRVTEKGRSLLPSDPEAA